MHQCQECLRMSLFYDRRSHFIIDYIVISYSYKLYADNMPTFLCRVFAESFVALPRGVFR